MTSATLSAGNKWSISSLTTLVSKKNTDYIPAIHFRPSNPFNCSSHRISMMCNDFASFCLPRDFQYVFVISTHLTIHISVPKYIKLTLYSGHIVISLYTKKKVFFQTVTKPIHFSHPTGSSQ